MAAVDGGAHRATAAFADLIFTEPTALLRGRTSWTRSDYLNLIAAGSYPEVLGLAPADRRTWYESYLRTVISRDIVEFAQIERSAAIPRLLALLAARAGGTAVVAELAKDSEPLPLTSGTYVAFR